MVSGFGSFAANIWAGSFLRQLRKELTGVVPEPKKLCRQCHNAAVTLFRETAPSLSDKRDKTTIACCSLVLFAYRELQAHLDDVDAFVHVKAAVERVFQRPMRYVARIWLWLTRRPLKRLADNRWKRQSERMYGPGMEFDQEDSDGCVELIVRRCAFHQFFLVHGVPQLTQAFCAWDRNWMDVVDIAGRSVRTERPATISTGGDCCRFRLVAADDRPATDQHDVVLIQLTQPK